MPITALLCAPVLWCLLYGALPPVPLGVLCAVVALALLILGRHDHGGGALHIDALAQRSRLLPVNPGLKAGGSLALLLICICADSPVVGLALALCLGGVTVAVGRLPLRDYLSLLSLPAAFLLMSTLAILFSFGPAPVGVLSVPLFGGFFSVTATAQATSALVLCKALGAVSCLYLLSLSTPLSELIALLRRFHVPAVLVELMYLIYRYLFILMELHRAMRDAAESRLGYHGPAASLRTTGAVYTGLLARSFRRAGVCFDAMESRCYDGELRFLEHAKPVTALHLCAGLGLVALTSALALLGRSL